MYEPRRISYSQITCYKRCKKKWYFRYVKNLQPIYTPRPLTVGKLVHAGMENYYSGKDWKAGMLQLHEENLNEIKNAKSLYEEEMAEYLREEEERYVDSVGIMERFVEHDKKDPLLPEGWKVVALEEEFEVSVDGARDYLYGFIDMIVEDPYGGIWGVEHKTGEQFFNVEQLSLSEQTTLYIGVMKAKFGADKVKGMIYNLLRTKKPSVPKTTKNGMSRAAIDTTWEIYEEELLKNNLDPADYEDMKAKLENTKFFDRTYTYRTNTEINNFFSEVAIVMEEISYQREEMCYRTPTKDCSWDCKDFNELCIMDFKGLDATEYIARTYTDRRRGRNEGKSFLDMVEEASY